MNNEYVLNKQLFIKYLYLICHFDIGKVTKKKR